MEYINLDVFINNTMVNAYENRKFIHVTRRRLDYDSFPFFTVI